ncbi:MAG: MFS transporter [Pseudomonadota bacterium]
MSHTASSEQSGDDSQAIVRMVTLFTFGSALPISTINVALPYIARELQISAAVINWVPLIFLLASVMLVLPCGQLAEIYGRIRLFKLSIWLVIASAIAISFSSTVPMLLVLRFAQGCAAAVGFVLLISIVSSAVAKETRGRAFGIIASAMYFGLTAGPLMAGYVTAYFSWRWTFLLHIPFMVLALLVGHLRVRSAWKANEDLTFDSLGALSYACGVLLLTLGILSIPARLSPPLILLGLIGLFYFARSQSRRQSPLINVNLFRQNRSFSYSCLASIFMYAANFSSLILASLYLQYLKEISVETTGWILMINPLFTALLTPIAGRSADKFEPRIVASFGITLTAIGLIILAVADANTQTSTIIFSMISLGFGFAFFAPVNAHAIMGSILEKEFSTGAAAHASVRLIGQLSSIAVVSMIFGITIGQAQITPETYPELSRALRYCFMLAAFACLPAYYFSINRGKILTR